MGQLSNKVKGYFKKFSKEERESAAARAVAERTHSLLEAIKALEKDTGAEIKVTKAKITTFEDSLTLRKSFRAVVLTNVIMNPNGPGKPYPVALTVNKDGIQSLERAIGQTRGGLSVKGDKEHTAEAAVEYIKSEAARIRAKAEKMQPR